MRGPLVPVLVPLLAVVAATTTTTTAAAAAGYLTVSPDTAGVTRRWTASMGAAISPDLPADSPQLRKGSAGCDRPEQVHLTYWSSDAVLVSWASCDAQLGATSRVSADGIISRVFFGTSPTQLDRTADGVATSYAYDYSSLGYGTSYASPVLHHVLLTGLQPGTRYYYKPAASNSRLSGDLSGPPDGGRLYDFKTLQPASFPLRIGVFGDPGQTYNTSATLERLIAAQPELLLLTGDFTYADNFVTADQFARRRQRDFTATYQPKWDTWGRLFEPLLSHVPLLHVAGNHELELLPNGDRATAYNHRFPTPYLTKFDTSKGPTSFPASTAARGGDPFANLYYSAELPGVFKAITLTSYAPGQSFGQEEAQYKWLEQELKQTDRSRTPWLLVLIHAPWYHTYTGHYKEAECMRQAYERLFTQHRVDLVYSGHVHAYERTLPVSDYKVGSGPVHITIGDAGNSEGLYKEFVDLQDEPLAICTNPKASNNTRKLFPPTYQPQACFSYQDGSFCPSSQPAWSAYREPSFGFGVLEVASPTKATWRWFTNQGGQADEVIIQRNGKPSSSSSSSEPSSNSSSGEGWLPAAELLSEAADSVAVHLAGVAAAV